jgi:hypothetical protein
VDLRHGTVTWWLLENTELLRIVASVKLENAESEYCIIGLIIIRPELPRGKEEPPRVSRYLNDSNINETFFEVEMKCFELWFNR